MDMIKDYGDYAYNYDVECECYIVYHWNCTEWQYEHGFETEKQAQDYCEYMQSVVDIIFG